MKTWYIIKINDYTCAIADVGLMDPEQPKLYLLSRINVLQKHRREGIGSKLLKMVLADADAEGVTLFLQVAATGGMTNSQLERWYKRTGFVYRTPDGFMWRDPKPAPILSKDAAAK